MTSEWVTPEIVELTLEEVAELSDLDIACAASVDDGSGAYLDYM